MLDKSVSAIAVGALLVFTRPAAAQVDPMPYVSIQAANMQYGQLLKSNIGGGRSRATARAPQYGADVARSPVGGDRMTSGFGGGSPTAQFRYAASPAVSRSVVDGYLSRAAKTSPEGARSLGDQLQNHDYRKIYRGLTAGNGLREDDAADALTAYTVLGWLIANNEMGNPDPRAVQGLRRQVASHAGENSSFTPQKRALMGEEMKLLFVTLHAGWQGAQREGKLREYSDGVANLFLRQGTDLRAVRLTPAGFEPRG